MKIQTVIEKMKAYCKGSDKQGNPIDPIKTRDQILWGNTDQECTGIVSTCFASAAVIEKAIELNCNLIISHEALFWNHGDHTDWLKDNEIFQKKTALLDSKGIVVWRNHDYIHSGIPMDGGYVDGIFYGVLDKLGWKGTLYGDMITPISVEFDQPIDGADLIQTCKKAFNLNGVRYIGELHTPVKKVMFPSHLIGGVDNQVMERFEKENFDCMITMEVTDFTVSEYVRDSALLGHPRLGIEVGHFNTEEPGMEYMVKYVNHAIEDSDMPVYFVKSADGFNYIVD